MVAVYKHKGARNMDLAQVLPTGVGPEGLLPILGRKLFIASTEGGDPVRSQINILRLEQAAPAYAQIASVVKADGNPIAWGALSALAADKDDADKLYTVHDKLEGLACAVDGTVYAVTDNDGVDDSPGETQFLKLGKSLD